jgi:hypothetical protein
LKKYFPTALVSGLIFGPVLSSAIVVVGAAEKPSGNYTVSNISVSNISKNLSL